MPSSVIEFEKLLSVHSMRSLRAISAAAIQIYMTPENEMAKYFTPENFEYARTFLIPVLKQQLASNNHSKPSRLQLLQALMVLQVLHVTNLCMQATDDRHAADLSGISFYSLLEDHSRLCTRFNIVDMPYAELLETLAREKVKLPISIFYALNYLKPQVWTYGNPAVLTITGTSITNCGTITYSGTITISGGLNLTGQPPVLSDFDKYVTEMKAWNYFYSAVFKCREHVLSVIKPDNTQVKKRNGKPLTYLAEFSSGLRPEKSKCTFYFDQRLRDRILGFLAPDSITPLKAQRRLNMLKKPRVSS